MGEGFDYINYYRKDYGPLRLVFVVDYFEEEGSLLDDCDFVILKTIVFSKWGKSKIFSHYIIELANSEN